MSEPLSQEILISPARRLKLLDMGELYAFRELLFFLVWRDLKVRYKQSLLGVAWIILRPLTAMAIFTVIFGRFAKLPSDGAPYAVFVLLGLVPWGYFSSILTSSATSIVSGRNLITKIYFPRIMVPLSASLSQAVDLFISIAFLLVVLLLYGLTPGIKVLFLPALIIFAAFAATGPGFLFSALYVKYRDVEHIIPFLAQIWMYATPVVYSAGMIPGKYRWVLYINPMAGVVEGFRACFIPGKSFDWQLMAVSAAMSLFMFLLGLYYFRSVERTFADNI